LIIVAALLVGRSVGWGSCARVFDRVLAPIFGLSRLTEANIGMDWFSRQEQERFAISLCEAYFCSFFRKLLTVSDKYNYFDVLLFFDIFVCIDLCKSGGRNLL